MKQFRIPLLGKIVIAIFLGIICELFFPLWLTRIFITFNGLFSNFLGFIIPLLILGLVAPGIFELKGGAGKLQLLTTAIAYVSTVLAGTISFYTCEITYPAILDFGKVNELGHVLQTKAIEPFFKMPIPPLMDVTSSLVLAFFLGLCLNYIKSDALKRCLYDFRECILMTIRNVIIPVLPLYIFGIFLKIAADGEAGLVLSLFIKVIAVIFILHILWLVLQFCIAGAISGRNPFKALLTMMPAYFTALGTQSSAATIPVTLERAKKNGIDEKIADFVIPLCATIHLSGSCLKIVACAFAVLFMNGVVPQTGDFILFICMLSITMVAAPGVPGGAIMAALGPLAEYLGFDASAQALMIALYIAMDSFGTACNVTGDGAIALIIDKIHNNRG